MKMSITENYQRIREEIPKNVTIVLAAKTRSKDEILEVIAAGSTDIGENYVQEAKQVYSTLGEAAKKLDHLSLEGLMTMGPRVGDPERIRPYFKKTKNVFDKIKSLNLPNINMKTLSMGMSNSYKIAIEEGSNMVRLGTIVFGIRKCCLK